MLLRQDIGKTIRGWFSFKTKCYEITDESGLIPSTGNAFKDCLVKAAGVIMFILILYGVPALILYILFSNSLNRFS